VPSGKGDKERKVQRTIEKKKEEKSAHLSLGKAGEIPAYGKRIWRTGAILRKGQKKGRRAGEGDVLYRSRLSGFRQKGNPIKEKEETEQCRGAWSRSQGRLRERRILFSCVPKKVKLAGGGLKKKLKKRKCRTGAEGSYNLLRSDRPGGVGGA